MPPRTEDRLAARDPEAERGGRPAGQEARNRRLIGPAIFLATLLASLVFFWWFLIAEHGLPGGQ